MTLSLFAGTLAPTSTADIDGEYRYRLTRRWGEGLALPWIMLNPSTADAEQDDPTIRRVVGFTLAAGYNALVVVNLYALRATDPRALRQHPVPVGLRNDAAIESATAGAPLVVAAWGAVSGATVFRARNVLAHVRGHITRPRLVCLGTTQAGDPRHPLYVRGDTAFVGYAGRPPEVG